MIRLTYLLRRVPRLSLEDCGYFIDLSRSPMWAAKEHVIVDRKRIVSPLPKPGQALQ